MDPFSSDRWWFQVIFVSKIGEDEAILTHILQRGFVQLPTIDTPKGDSLFFLAEILEVIFRFLLEGTQIRPKSLCC